VPLVLLYSRHLAEHPLGINRLRATWTPELDQDIAAFHNIDADAELTRMLTDHLSQEINREVINQMFSGCFVSHGMTIIRTQPPISLPIHDRFINPIGNKFKTAYDFIHEWEVLI